MTDGTNALNLVTGVTYNAASQATAVTYGNGDSDTFTPDPNTGRITGYKNTMTGSGAFVDTGTLGWNANGSLGSFQWVDGNNSARNQSCTYAADAVNRIVSANCGSAWAQTFSYDAFGNVFKAGSSTYSPSSYVNNQPVSNVTATYDANGNQTMTTLVASLTYDANHHPVTAGSTAMVYDAFGRLVEAGGKAVVYGPAGEKLGVFNGSAYTTAFLLPGGSEAYYTSGALTSLRRKDWLGSSRVATSWSHAVVSKAAYAPFGESYSVGGTTDLDFTGQTQDSVSSLYDFPARKYDPGAGRWTVPDPGGWSVVDLTNPQSFNRYAYVLNMPLVFIDPSGMDPCDDTPDSACCQPVSDCEDEGPDDGGDDGDDSQSAPPSDVFYMKLNPNYFVYDDSSENLFFAQESYAMRTIQSFYGGPNISSYQTAGPGPAANAPPSSNVKVKSRARQRCEQQAQAKAQAATGAIRASFWNDIVLGAKIGGTLGAVFGCAGGAIAGSVATGPGTVVGCVIGGGAGISEGIAGGIASTAIFDAVRSQQATATLKQELAACAAQ